jgi:hypothetical protein
VKEMEIVAISTAMLICRLSSDIRNIMSADARYGIRRWLGS